VGLPHRISCGSQRLTIERNGPHWRASISGAEASFDGTTSDIRLAFPNEGGLFRGHLRGYPLVGYWVRRAVTDDPRYPAGAAQGYAMPIAFAPAEPNTWRATVTPCPTRSHYI
jgi:hypothetical protein